MSRILIVDDREDGRYFLQVLLQGHGHNVEQACNGADALTNARNTTPDLVISDLLMPVMDGYTLLRNWKSDKQLQEIPFLIYTATYTDPKDEKFALNLGADDFIVKPTDPEVLLERIQHLLDSTERKSPLFSPDSFEDNSTLYKEYNEVLIHKLESKMEQLEQTNLALQKDIQQRIEIEESLRKLSAAVEQSSAAVLITDLSGTIEYANPRFLSMTGYSLNEVLGKKPSFLKSSETTSQTHKTLWENITAGKQWHGELRNKKKDGALYWDKTTISPIRDSSGKTTHYLAIKEDITGEKSLQAQYLHAQKMEAIGRLAGGIAHDFNNMLNVILGYTDAVLMELTPVDPIYADLGEVRSAAKRSAELTRQLLAFSRQHAISPEVLNMNTHLEGMKLLLNRLIGEDVTTKFVLQEDLWPVKMDPSQVDQILANLAVNARDAMPNGGQFIIETSNCQLSEDDCKNRSGFIPGDYQMLSVSDTGCGMSQETISHIFEPFFTTKEEGKGTGLGLATVYGAVRQSNGFIHVYSEIDQGTTFRLYIPRHIGEGIQDSEPRNAPKPVGGKETILIVEDDEMLRKLSDRMLKRLGYNVLTASSPGEAIAICENPPSQIHLLLTDVIMPIMNGKDLQENISSRMPDIKVLFMSGYTADSIAHRGVLEEGIHFIEKPFGMHELDLKIREILNP